eukprot:TRINITY_DN116116_c0_g1_i1.p4 TRINITY_DN116116_c0_g1~~TRINITY_DN116116_c0_g1_i1.p4  ORF type:complete len:102 (-),score=43.39 TRINITY_DN116116_c0_g1_i1:461-766(-)
MGAVLETCSEGSEGRPDKSNMKKLPENDKHSGDSASNNSSNATETQSTSSDNSDDMRMVGASHEFARQPYVVNKKDAQCCSSRTGKESWDSKNRNAFMLTC